MHINEGSDGTQKWADTVRVDSNGEGVLYTYSPENVGICKAMNWAFDKATKDYIVYLNDDMYVLPDWDKFLIEEIKARLTGKNNNNVVGQGKGKKMETVQHTISVEQVKAIKIQIKF